jgi:IclR family pca regulon transcriptional regulator
LAARDWIAGLERGLSIIETFDEAHPRLSAPQVAQRCGLTRTAARRYLLTLAHLGYMATDGKLFWLTPRVMRLGQSYLESARLPRIVQPFLQRLAASTHETSYLSVLDGDEIVYVARNGPVRHMNTGFVLGARVPAQVTAAGMLLMALKGPAAVDAWLSARSSLQTFSEHTITDLPAMRAQLLQIRQQDWALSEQQLDLDYRGVAVPLRDRMGETVGALSIIMPMQHEVTADALRRVLPLLKETAQSMRNLI